MMWRIRSGTSQMSLADGEHSLARQQAQRDRHEDDRHEAEPELRDRVPDDAEDADDVVDPAAAPERRHDPERDPDGELKEEGGERELQRRAHALEEQSERRLVVLERHTEVAAHDLGDPAHVLDPERLVQPVVRAKPLDVFFGDVQRAEGVEAYGITRGEPRDEEHDDRDAEERGNRVEEPPQDVFPHLG